MNTTVVARRTEELEEFFHRYKDVPHEVIVKEDILRWGIRFSEASLAAGRDYRARSYFIFSYDRTGLDEMKKGESTKAPDELRIMGGLWGLRPTLVSARIHNGSPWEVDVLDGQLVLRADGEVVAEVQYPSQPQYYSRASRPGRKTVGLFPTM